MVAIADTSNRSYTAEIAIAFKCATSVIRLVVSHGVVQEPPIHDTMAVSPSRGRSIVIMRIPHKRIDAGEACPLPCFQFFRRLGRRGFAGQFAAAISAANFALRAS